MLKCKWIICKHCHCQCSNKGSDTGRHQNCRLIHSCCCEHGWIDCKDIRHCHKCGDTRHHFRFGGGFVFAQLKDLFKHSFHSLLFFFRSPTFSTGRDCILAHLGGSLQRFSEFLSPFFCKTFGFSSFPASGAKTDALRPPRTPNRPCRRALRVRSAVFGIERLFAPRLAHGGAREADEGRYAISALQASTSSAFSLAESSGCLAFVLT